MRRHVTIWLVLTGWIAVTAAYGQPAVRTVRKLSLDTSTQWGSPRFSPDGRKIFFTTVSYDGIWEYDLASAGIRKITGDPGAGYGFAVDPQSELLAFRRTTIDPKTHRRHQEIVLQDLRTGSPQVIGAGNDLSLPAFSGGGIVYSTPAGLQNRPAASASSPLAVLGIEDQKIALIADGRKMLLDPFGDGRYIWPSLSPDGSSVLAFESRRGAFVCRTDGSQIVQLGRRDAPSWAHDGRWIAFMDERDDGHQILSSHILLVSRDGGTVISLTDGDRVDLDPQCSPTDNHIVFSTGNGEIYLLEYGEERR